ncbi:unnamed protein product, partial [Iphiclides podalirius]
MGRLQIIELGALDAGVTSRKCTLTLQRKVSFAVRDFELLLAPELARSGSKKGRIDLASASSLWLQFLTEACPRGCFKSARLLAGATAPCNWGAARAQLASDAPSRTKCQSSAGEYVSARALRKRNVYGPMTEFNTRLVMPAWYFWIGNTAGNGGNDWAYLV